MMSADRLLRAGLLLAGYAVFCAIFVLRERRRRAAEARRLASLDTAAEDPVLVGFASQTGFAEELAWRTAASLQAAGLAVRLMPLSEICADTLARCRRALLIASTSGEGDTPDAAAAFAQRVMNAQPALAGLRFGVLALGDRSYTHFCAFGRRLDAWLAGCGAQSLFERIEVDAGNEAALRQWQLRLAALTGGNAAPDWQPAAFRRWRVTARRLLNPGSVGAPLAHVELAPPDGALPAWEAGDLVQIRIADDARPREYSIASLPADGSLHLVVRRFGLVSGLLCEQLPLGDEVDLLLRPNSGFRLAANAGRPLLLVGNGSGIAGLRAHLKAAAARASGGHWLVFGEREPAHDAIYADELEAWLADGTLARLDRVFSRDGGALRYVQHQLCAEADALRGFVAEGAAIYVCGSREGMAEGVDAALREILGAGALAALAADGRYRRDVY